MAHAFEKKEPLFLFVFLLFTCVCVCYRSRDVEND